MPSGGKRTGAGRPRGSKTRWKADIAERLHELGLDPIEGLVKIAKNPKTPILVRSRVLIELAGFVVPKLSAITHSGGEAPILVERSYGAVPAIEQARPRALPKGKA